MAGNKAYKPHAIQLIELRVAELAFKVNLSAPKDSALEEFSIATAHSDYDAEKHQIRVKMRVVSGDDDDEDSILNLKVELLGVFEIDEKEFPVDKVIHWAEHNAPLVLYPYVRENVYSLTSRAGFTEALLPLIEIPTFRVEKPSVDVAEKSTPPKVK